MTIIKTYSQLIEYIRNNNLNVKQASVLITESLSVWIVKDYNNTDALLSDVETYWQQWKHTIERPLFLEDFKIEMLYNNSKE